jgi:excinuclease ABC subunit C
MDSAEVQGFKLVPDKPGIYKYYNQDGVLIYVGKAKNLKKRVSSYFVNKTGLNRKTQILVKEITRVEYTISETEFDAFLLENNLIKENQPKYNILLKDDKSFPFICLTNERFPRIFSTRRVIKSQGKYFGPYTSVVAMNHVLELIRRLYTIRTCKYNLSEENVSNGKYKVCLEYHIGNCLGPCEGLQSEEAYLEDIQLAKHILKGNLHTVKTIFKKQMDAYASNLEFERAHAAKEKLDMLDKFQSKSIVVSPTLNNIHVLAISSDDTEAFLSYLRVKNGSINFTKTTRVKKKLGETNEELLRHMAYAVGVFDQQTTEILSNIELEDFPASFQTSVPQIGDKRKLVEMCLRNALEFKKEHLALRSNLKGSAKETLVMLQKDLNLKNVPLHIECFDNSNLMGSNPVASMVCFKNGVPAKKEYRHYNIKTVEGPDDFSSMSEIITRRYKRILEEKTPLPDLIIVDGGKGQLSASVDALKAIGIYGKVPIIGIAKRLEEIYFPNDSLPLHIQKKSPSLKLIQRARDEAHRFAINFHRQKRSKKAISTQLEEIPGVGGKTATKLLKKFKSVKKIREATVEELEPIVGSKLAELLASKL